MNLSNYKSVSLYGAGTIEETLNFLSTLNIDVDFL